MKEDILFKYRWWVLGGIMLLGILLRVVLIGKDLVFDDVFSVYFSQLSIGQIIYFSSIEMSEVPLYTILLHTWTLLFGISEWAIRGLNIIFSIITVVVVYALGRQLFSWRAGLISASLISLSSFHVMVSAEVRAYTLVVLLASISLYALVRYIKQPSWWLFGTLTLVNTLLVYTHLQGVLLLLAEGLFCFVVWKKNRIVARWLFVSIVLTVLILLPWLFMSTVPNLISGDFVDSWTNLISEEYSYFMVIDLIINFILTLALLSSTILPLAAAWYGGVLLFFLLGMFHWRLPAVWTPNSSETKVHMILLLLVFFTTLIPFFIYLIPVPKYFIIGSLPLYIIVGYGLSKIKLRHVTLVSVVVIIASVALFFNALQERSTIHSRADSISYIAENVEQNDTVLVHHFKIRLFFDYYYDGQAPYYGVFPKEDVGDLDYEIARYNSLLRSFINEENIGILEPLVRDVQRLWIFDNTADAIIYGGPLIHTWLNGEGWMLQEKQDLSYGTLYLYKKISNP